MSADRCSEVNVHQHKHPTRHIRPADTDRTVSVWIVVDRRYGSPSHRFISTCGNVRHRLNPLTSERWPLSSAAFTQTQRGSLPVNQYHCYCTLTRPHGNNQRYCNNEVTSSSSLHVVSVKNLSIAFPVLSLITLRWSGIKLPTNRLATSHQNKC